MSQAELLPLPGQEEEFERLFERITDQLTTLRLKWRIYRAFFGTNAERVDLLNSISGTTALILQDALYDDVILSLCRLADSAGEGQKKNDTVERLMQYCDDSAARDQLVLSVEELKSACRILRKHRNLHIAHADRRANLNREKAGGISRKQIEDAIEALKNFVSLFSLSAHQAKLSTELISPYATDEVEFLRALYYGQMKLRELRDEAMDLVHLPADPRYEPPEQVKLRELNTKPEWLNYRQPECFD